MNKRVLIFVILLALVVCGALILKPKDADNKVHEPLVKEESKEVENPLKEPDISPEEQELLEQFTPEEVENLRYSHEAAQAANQSVIFYGQCMDQNGIPIEGVLVEAKLTKMRKSMLSVVANDSFKFAEILQAVSDEKGRFEFIDEGSSLSLTKMQKDGYLSAEKALYGGYQFGQILVGGNMAGMHQADPLNPVTFTLWKKSESSSEVDVKRNRSFRSDMEIKKSSLGRGHYFDLSRGSVVSRPSPNSMEVIALNDADSRWDPEQFKHVGRGSNTAWSYTLSIPEGGLIKTDDVFLFRPPESGYKESFKFEIPEGEDGWISQITDQKFYFVTSDKNYGAFILEVRAQADGAMSFFFNKLYFNPSGARDLENY